NAQPSASLTPGIFHNVRDINQAAVSATKALPSGEKKNVTRMGGLPSFQLIKVILRYKIRRARGQERQQFINKNY
ncbi:hypothetical protein, partial [Enterobacter hormaechei]|uniref:hypothetical protein n=1 Tax=Enterobacter hormaechei TaxID=158836 RepID=UPI002040BAF0